VIPVSVDVEEIVYQGATIPSYVVVEKSGSVDRSRYVATLTHEPLPLALNVHCSSRSPKYSSGLPDTAGANVRTKKGAKETNEFISTVKQGKGVNDYTE